MNKLTGQLKKIGLIEGSLSLINGMNLIGELSILTNTLTGILAFKKSGLLVGTLASIEDKVLNGNITKPEVSTVPNYQGEYLIIPEPFNNKVLKTSGFKMTNNVTVSKIPYYQTSNETGYTVYIGGEE